MRLIDAYTQGEEVCQFLYRVLYERPVQASVFHSSLPTYEKHREFFAGRPYAYWYVIDADGKWVGSTSLTSQGEIGIFILKPFQRQGYARYAVETLVKSHKMPLYRAMISVENIKSHMLFASLGFTERAVIMTRGRE